jgi:hypothetical protein
MTNPVDKRKKKEKLEIAERKVEKAWIRASKINKKLKRAKKKDEKEVKQTLKFKLQDAYKRLKRNKKELSKFERKVL